MYENYRVLFVDDEPNILNSLRRGLLDEEYYSQFALSGKEALEMIRKDPIAVIVTDMRMPEMNGLDLLNLVAEESPSTVKVVLSGYTQLPQILATVNQVDIFKFITKPWSMDEFIQVIRKALDYYMLQEENVKYRKMLEAKNKSYQNILKKINEIIDDAKKSKELLGLCGKAMVGFGKDFSEEERLAFQEVFSLRESLFDLLTEKVSTQQKRMRSDELTAYFSAYLENLYPDSSVEIQEEKPMKISVNLRMAEAALDALWLVFSDEFTRSGLYCRIRCKGQLTLTILSPKAAVLLPAVNGAGTEIEAKIELIRTVLAKPLELCQIKLQILTVEESLAAELTVLSTTEESD